MLCLICRQAGLVEGFTSIVLERGAQKLVVKNVPARICPGCGEACVEEGVAVRLLQDAEEASGVGMLNSVQEYFDTITP